MGKTYLQGETLTATDLNASFAEAVNTTGSYTFTGVHTHSANVTMGTNGVFSSSNTISDRIGNVRQVPLNSVSTGYTLVALDSGKVVYLSSGSLTVPANVFSAGDTVTILNSSTSASITITQGSGLTMYWAGQASATSGNRTLGLLSMSTILFTSSTVSIIAGAGLT